MITLYINDTCPDCDEIRTALETMCLAHKTTTFAELDLRATGLPHDARPPVLVDNGEVVHGRQAIRAHLEQLESLRQQWQKFQSDACYCDDEGNVE